MIIEQELKKFKSVFDAELEKYLDQRIVQAKKISPWAVSFVGDLKKYMLAGGGGKRIRPALMYFGYLALGGEKRKEMIRASMSVELLHASFLIQDDIIDRDDLRHGEKTMHYYYSGLAKKDLNLDKAESCHYGISQAICSADIAFKMAFKMLIESSFEEKIKIKAIDKLCDLIFNTAVGEMSDVLAEDTKDITEEQAINILEYKTARYTVEGPLHLGLIMAGAGDKLLKDSTAFSIPLGIAFQIQDDILGVFGTSEETGKPVGADIREGKKTLLIVKALEWGSANDKKEIMSALSNRRVSAAQVEKVKQIIIDTGSLEYSKKLAEKLVDRSRRALMKSKLSKKNKKFFSDIAGFIIKRKY